MDVEQFSLFDQPVDALAQLPSGGWPNQQRFPHNAGRNSVGDVVLADLRSDTQPLILTGYASLDRLLDFLDEASRNGAKVRLLLGNEPSPARQDHIALAGYDFPRVVTEYWLARGISLRLSGKIVAVMEQLKQRRVQVRFVEPLRLHAKMYCTQKAVTLGSSNFSTGGLRHHLEANARFPAEDKQRFREAWQLAERYWHEGRDFSPELLNLLEKLLRPTSWQESLARACAELLEGEWADQYLSHQRLPGDLPLWPSQRQGIAQALYLIDTVGSVLIADATGSGKTRMGANLVRAAIDRIWSSGRMRRGMAMLVCPPSVKETWDREARLCHLPLDVHSHGALSHAGANRQRETLEAVRRAQVLAVDEAHNFLNSSSNRTRRLLGNMADHTVLFTATPINRGVTDLLRLVDMLGADNLDQDTLRMLEKLLRSRRVNQSLTTEEIRALRGEIQRFTLRRTKSMLNRMVEKKPDAYRDATGNPCRYPAHRSRTYALHESPDDRRIAAEIRERASRLKGVGYLKDAIEMPDVLRREGWSEEKYLRARLRAASRLPAHLVMATLRSSRAALLEHVRGTEWALEYTPTAGTFHKQATGNVRARVAELAGRPPENRLGIALPDWLTDAETHRLACREEEALYLEIGRLALQLSDGRERRKAEHLRELVAKRDLVLAFDSRPITLAHLHKLLLDAGVDVALATGSELGGRKQVLEQLRLGSDRKQLVALCSDSMSEGVNLQSASCIVHLDMPSVVRVAEQRVGRVDRMDSPHREIEAWWPEDAGEFALKSDERFVERHEQVEALLGSNLPLPEYFSGKAGVAEESVDAKTRAEEMEQSMAHSEWDGIKDAFTPIREMIEGEGRLIESEDYADANRLSGELRSSVSMVRSDSPWAFFCVRGSLTRAPKWILFRSPDAHPESSLPAIASALRERLAPSPEQITLENADTRLLDLFLDRLKTAERVLLPKKKQRALEEMETVLSRYRTDASRDNDQPAMELYKQLLDWLQHPGEGIPDWNDLAERWLDLIRPGWYALLSRPRRNRPLLLRDLRQQLLGEGRLSHSAVQEAFSGVRQAQVLEERVVACIIGVP